MKAGGIGTRALAVNWAGDPADREGRLRLEQHRRGRRDRGRAGAQGPALPLRHAALDGRKPTTLPIDNGQARKAWLAFVDAAVKRYGPGGEFWRRAPDRRHRPGQLRAGDPDPDSRSAPGRSGTRPTSSTSPTRSRRALREAAEDLLPGDQGATTRAPKSSSPASSANRPRAARGHAGGQVPRSPLPLAGNQEPASTGSPCTPTRSTRKRSRNWSRKCAK